jgi:hypothetical protein
MVESKIEALRGNVDALLTRYQHLVAKELENPAAWWWLSFSAGGEFLGVVIVYAHGLLEAVRICEDRKLNPGGEVLGAAMPPEKVPAEKYRCKLLSAELVSECTPGVKKIKVGQDDTVEKVE